MNTFQLSPIILSEFKYNGLNFKFKEAFIIYPATVEGSERLFFEYPELDIAASGFTREELINEIKENLYYGWEAYVVNDDLSDFTDKHLAVREAYNSCFEHIKPVKNMAYNFLKNWLKSDGSVFSDAGVHMFYTSSEAPRTGTDFLWQDAVNQLLKAAIKGGLEV